MTGYARKMVLGVFSGALCLTGVAVPAEAAVQQQNGLVNVAVGDVTITDAVDIGVAAQIAAQICGVKVGPVALLGTVVDRSGGSATVVHHEPGAGEAGPGLTPTLPGHARTAGKGRRPTTLGPPAAWGAVHLQEWTSGQPSRAPCAAAR